MVLIWDFPTWTVIMCIPFFAFSTKNLPATEPTATYRPRLSTASAVVGFFKKRPLMYIKLHVHYAPPSPVFFLIHILSLKSEVLPQFYSCVKT